MCTDCCTSNVQSNPVADERFQSQQTRVVCLTILFVALAWPVRPVDTNVRCKVATATQIRDAGWSHRKPLQGRGIIAAHTKTISPEHPPSSPLSISDDSTRFWGLDVRCILKDTFSFAFRCCLGLVALRLLG